MMIKNCELLLEKDAVIFDMDGTLVDSMWIWPSVDDDYLKKYNLNKPEGFHESMEGMSYTESAQMFLDVFPELDCTIEEVKREWFNMTHEKYTKEVCLKEGALEFLHGLKEQGIKLGIATSNVRELVDITLKTLQIEELFDSVKTSCEAKKGKPAPDVYLLVAAELGVAPERCLVFEDVPMGILAGKNAGMAVCGIDDAFSRAQEEKKKELADYYILTYKDIANGTYEVL